jgi:hypothetical protein
LYCFAYFCGRIAKTLIHAVVVEAICHDSWGNQLSSAHQDHSIDMI